MGVVLCYVCVGVECCVMCRRGVGSGRHVYCVMSKGDVLFCMGLFAVLWGRRDGLCYV